MKNVGTVLMYNCAGEDFSKLRQIFAMLRLRMRPVAPELYHATLGELVLGKAEPEQPAPEAIEETMLVFCGLHPVFFKQVLDVIRLANLPKIHLMAILTETNQAWTTMQLREDLLKEKEKFEQRERESESGEKKD